MELGWVLKISNGFCRAHQSEENSAGFSGSFLLMAVIILRRTMFWGFFFLVNTRTEHPQNLCNKKKRQYWFLQNTLSKSSTTPRDLCISESSLFLWKIFLVWIHPKEISFTYALARVLIRKHPIDIWLCWIKEENFHCHSDITSFWEGDCFYLLMQHTW